MQSYGSQELGYNRLVLPQLSNNKLLLIGLATILFAACVLLSIFNVQFRVINDQLESDIDQLSEEKENLRARYLSEIALNELDRRALEMEMKQASSLGHYKLSAKQNNLKRQQLMQATVKPESRILISGY